MTRKQKKMLWRIVITAAMLVIGALAALPFGGKIAARLDRKGGVYQGAVYALAFVGLALSALCLSTSAYNPFIYFRF